MHLIDVVVFDLDLHQEPRLSRLIGLWKIIYIQNMQFRSEEKKRMARKLAKSKAKKRAKRKPKKKPKAKKKKKKAKR